MIRVLMLSEYPYDEREQGLGGILQATYQLIEGFKALGDNGLELHVVSMSRFCRRPEMRRHGPVALHFLPKSGSSFGIALRDPLRLLAYVRRLMRDLRPDIVHGQGTVTALLLSLMLSRRSIQTVHGIYRNELKTIPKDQMTRATALRYRAKIWLEDFYLKRIRNLIAITREAADLVSASSGGRARIYPVNNAIDEAFFAFDRSAERGVDGAARVLFVAAITPRKGLHFLIDAFAALAEKFPGASLRIVGTWDWAPDYVAEQRARAAASAGAAQIVFTGSVEPAALIEEFRSADILVLPSLAESAPMVISQAMCAGLAILSTKVGGIPEMIADGSDGLLVAPSDTAALTEALGRLVSDAALRQKLGASARRRGTERYHPRAIAKATLAAYRSAAEGTAAEAEGA